MSKNGVYPQIWATWCLTIGFRSGGSLFSDKVMLLNRKIFRTTPEPSNLLVVTKYSLTFWPKSCKMLLQTLDGKPMETTDLGKFWTQKLSHCKEPENLRKHQVRRRLRRLWPERAIKTCQIRRLSPGKSWQICFNRSFKTSDCNHRRKRGRFTRFHESKHAWGFRGAAVPCDPATLVELATVGCFSVFSAHFSKPALFDTHF